MTWKKLFGFPLTLKVEILGWDFFYQIIFIIRKKLKGFLDSDNYKLKIQLILLFIYAFIIIYSMSLIFNNIILSIGLSILVYVPAMISVLKKDFKTINNFNDN